MKHPQGGGYFAPTAPISKPNHKTRQLFIVVSIGILALWPVHAMSQQLDTDSQPRRGKVSQSRTMERYIPPGFLKPNAPHSISPHPQATHVASPATESPPTSYSSAQPLTATVTHTLYLPPAMYGQWAVNGTLMETNAPDMFSPTVSDIWLLEREGNQVTVTNPVNGAYATINVDKAEGDQATFHRSGTVGKHTIFQEIPTITVHGDTFSGQSLNKMQDIKAGRVVAEVYGIYRLEATRISAARTRFHPDSEQHDPDLQIEEIHH